MPISADQDKIGLFQRVSIMLLAAGFSACSMQSPGVKDPKRFLASYDHQNVTTCSECHAVNRPTGFVGTPAFDHSKSGGNGECATCHLAVRANLGKSWAGGQFSHSPKPSTCVECHYAERPTSTSGWAALNSNTPFDYASHGGSLDCVTCHTSTNSYSRQSDWATGNYTHSQNLTSCAECHSSQRPTTIVSGFNHSISGMGDCIGCHASSLNSTFSRLSDWQGAAAMPAGLIWDPSQDVSLTAKIPTWSGTSITSFATNTITLHQAMSHSSSQVPSSLLQSCDSCHADASIGNYLPGSFHDSVTAANLSQPSSCTDCHSIANPTGFVGPIASDRSPASAEMRHEAVKWSTAGNGTVSITTQKIVTQDCAVCHKQPGAQWSGASYHASLTSASQPQPTSCLDCHANSRPSGLVPTTPPPGITQFDHKNGGTGDCVSCHTSTSSWSGGSFHSHAATQTSCNTCHMSDRPANTTGWVGLNTNIPFDYASHGGTRDCITCHASVSTFATKANWAGGNFVHTNGLVSCSECHSSQRPSSIVNGFNHSTAGTGDCVGCHKNSLNTNFTSMSNWQGGESQPSGLVGSQTTSLTATHLNYTGTRVTSSNTVTESLPEQMLHSSAQVPGSISQNCAACHTGAGTGQYAGGHFHASLTTASLAQPSTCKDCHLGTLPTDIVGPAVKPMDHAALFTNNSSVKASYDCAVCHKQPGSTWSDGSFHAKIGSNTPANCTVCHYVEVPQTLTNKMLHSSSQVTNDCTSCHAQPTAAQAAAPALSMWSGGLFHSKISTQPSTCIDCHQGQRPASITTSSNDSQHMSHSSSSVASDCAACHKGDINLSPRQWSKAALFHPVVTSLTTCQECHGLGNGSTVAGTGNDLPAGLTAASQLTSSSVAPAGTHDQVTHTDVNIGNKDCKSCHTQTGMSGAKWKSASFHINVPNLTMNQSSGRCDHCHANLKPTVLVGGMDHSTIGSQDCSSCHTYPGTGSAGAGNWLGATAGAPHTVAFIQSNQNTCISCHTASGSKTPPIGMPTTVLKAVKSGNGGAIDFAHNFTSTTAGSTGTSTVTYNFTICLGCHAPAATNAQANNGQGYMNDTAWVGTGSFSTHKIPSAVNASTSPYTVTSATIKSCLPCHNREGQVKHCRSSTTVTPPDCVRCHTRAGSWDQNTSSLPTCK